MGFVAIIALAIVVAVFVAKKFLAPPPKMEYTSKKYPAAEKGNKKYTPEELAECNGSDLTKPLLLALSGKVYDVSPKSTMFGPDGYYRHAAGRDATALYAFGKVEWKDVPEQFHYNKRHELKAGDISKAQQEDLKERIEYFDLRFDVVGTLVY